MKKATLHRIIERHADGTATRAEREMLLRTIEHDPRLRRALDAERLIAGTIERESQASPNEPGGSRERFLSMLKRAPRPAARRAPSRWKRVAAIVTVAGIVGSGAVVLFERHDDPPPQRTAGGDSSRPGTPQAPPNARQPADSPRAAATARTGNSPSSLSPAPRTSETTSVVTPAKTHGRQTRGSAIDSGRAGQPPVIDDGGAGTMKRRSPVITP
jgi:cytoskeletal protein RodZ